MLSIVTQMPELLVELAKTDCDLEMEAIRKWDTGKPTGHRLLNSFSKFMASDKIAQDLIKKIKKIQRSCPDYQGETDDGWKNYLCGQKIVTPTEKYDLEMISASKQLLTRFASKQGAKILEISPEDSEGLSHDGPSTTATIEENGVKYRLDIGAFNTTAFFTVSVDIVSQEYGEVEISTKISKVAKNEGGYRQLRFCIAESLKKLWKASCPDLKFSDYWITSKEPKGYLDPGSKIEKFERTVDKAIFKTLKYKTSSQPDKK